MRLRDVPRPLSRGVPYIRQVVRLCEAPPGQTPLAGARQRRDRGRLQAVAASVKCERQAGDSISLRATGAREDTYQGAIAGAPSIMANLPPADRALLEADPPRRRASDATDPRTAAGERWGVRWVAFSFAAALCSILALAPPAPAQELVVVTPVTAKVNSKGDLAKERLRLELLELEVALRPFVEDPEARERLDGLMRCVTQRSTAGLALGGSPVAIRRGVAEALAGCAASLGVTLPGGGVGAYLSHGHGVARRRSRVPISRLTRATAAVRRVGRRRRR
jgi:hypothetical protein